MTFTRAGGDLSGQLKVVFTLSGSLVGGSDYAALSGVAKIKAGKSSASLRITPLPGGANGKLNLRLAPGDGYTVGGLNKVKVKIAD